MCCDQTLDFDIGLLGTVGICDLTREKSVFVRSEKFLGPEAVWIKNILSKAMILNQPSRDVRRGTHIDKDVL